jgi:alkylation response protein AidB-like acyl-CoA dehydrogenase
MDYSLPNLAAQVEAFKKEIILPNILTWERDHEASRDFLREAAAQGFVGLQTSSESGGMGASFIDKLMFSRDMSGASMAVAFAIINTQNVAFKLSASPTARHRDEIAFLLRSGELVGCTALTEPHAGSDFAAIKTTAKKVDDGWILNGAKAWITNAAHAEISIAYAQTDPEKGWRGIASFVIDARRGGFERGKIYDLMGGHPIGVGEYHLKDYHAPDDDMLAPPGEAFKAALASINGARAYAAAMCAGMISDALEKAIAYCKSRQSFGQPLLSHQGLKWSLVDVALQLECLDLLIEKAGKKIESGEDAILSSAMAKKLAGEITIPALTACSQAMGANGVLEDNLIGHHIACAKISAFIDGSTEMMNERIAGSF